MFESVYALGIIFVALFVGIFIALLVFGAIFGGMKRRRQHGDFGRRTAVTSLILTIALTAFVGLVGFDKSDFSRNSGESSDSVAVTDRTQSTTTVQGRNERQPRPQPQPRPDKYDRDEGQSSSEQNSTQPRTDTVLNNVSLVIEAPDDAETVATIYHTWEMVAPVLNRRSYTVQFELDYDEVLESQAFINELDRSADRYDQTFFNTIGCDYYNSSISEVYIKECQYIYEYEEDRVTYISEAISDFADDEGFTDMELLYFVIDMFQNLEYNQPMTGTDILPPVVTIYNEWGDCDTVSILTYCILEDLGYEVLMMASDEYAHAMLGVAVNGTGSYLTYEGLRYYFVEMTMPEWYIGELDASCENERYWYGFKLDESSSTRRS